MSKVEELKSLRSARELASVFDIKYNELVYHTYIKKDDEKYKVFELKKKGGGTRTIYSPNSKIKIIQRKLADILLEIYTPRPCVYGYIRKTGIKDNAKTHAANKYVLNIDLENFFPSINYGRIRGVFMNYPFGLNSEIASFLAKICCFDNFLPQGAPTSPILSNFVCYSLDKQLLKLASKNKCYYSRYADDITFSTSVKDFPDNIYNVSTGVLGTELLDIVQNNGFTINLKKVSFRSKKERQVVTGLTVNKFPNVDRRYIRRIRAILNHWNQSGIEEASKKFLSNYAIENKKRNTIRFEKIIAGMVNYVGYIKGRNSPIYMKFRYELNQLFPEARLPNSPAALQVILDNAPVIFTEGATDWMHINFALNKFKKMGKYEYLFFKSGKKNENLPTGSSELLKYCKAQSQTKNDDKKYIFIFDRDEPGVINEVQPKDQLFKDWGNGVYSFCIPVPSFRENIEYISIEQYYKDEEITITDGRGYRLYLSSEFRPNSGRHLSENLICPSLKKKLNHTYVIDDNVLDADEKNVALPKYEFASFVVNEQESYKDLNIEHFSLIMDVILNILKVPFPVPKKETS